MINLSPLSKLTVSIPVILSDCSLKFESGKIDFLIIGSAAPLIQSTSEDVSESVELIINSGFSV